MSEELPVKIVGWGRDHETGHLLHCEVECNGKQYLMWRAGAGWHAADATKHNDLVKWMEEQREDREPLEDRIVPCYYCGQALTLVRPGKHQCDNENCSSNHPEEG